MGKTEPEQLTAGMLSTLKTSIQELQKWINSGIGILCVME